MRHLRRAGDGRVGERHLGRTAVADWPPRSPPAGASHDTLLDHAYTGHAGATAPSVRDEQRTAVCRDSLRR
jgi:hypothetical protein